jgi:hypothetical protein
LEGGVDDAWGRGWGWRVVSVCCFRGGLNVMIIFKMLGVIEG